QLRQPGGDAGPEPLGHLGGDRSVVGPRIRAGPGAGWWAGPRGRGLPVSASYPAAGGGRMRPAVLFVCVHNAGRSQMAAGFLRALAGNRVEVLSAGSAPADEINP